MIYDILPVNNYVGNNSTTIFDFDFYIENENQLNVYFFDENEYKIRLECNKDYTINEFKNINGSYIIFPIQGSSYNVLSDKQKISLELSLPICQNTQYNNSDGLNYEALEYSFDYVTRLIQILSRKLSLCVKVEECSNKTPQELIQAINDMSYQAIQSANSCIQSLNSINVLKRDFDSNYDKFLKIDVLENEVDTKANVSLNNISSDALSLISGQSKPSIKYIDFELGASGSQYIAPANGSVKLTVTFSTNANNYITLSAMSDEIAKTSIINRSAHSGNCVDTIQCAKGDIITVGWSPTSATPASLKFYYDNGEVQ